MTFRMRAALFKDVSQVAGRDRNASGTSSKSSRQFASATRTLASFNADGAKIFIDGVIEGNPLASPPTLPNAAVIRSYRQPIFAIDADSMRADVWGYVDLDGDVCLEYRSHPLAYASAEAKSRFKNQHGFLPQQCEQNYGVLETQ